MLEIMKKEFGFKHMPQVENVFDRIKPFAMSSEVRENYDKLYKTFKFGESNSSDGCYIATMVYGSYNSYEVLILERLGIDFC